VHKTQYSLVADGEAVFTASCGTGQKAVGGGFDSQGVVFPFESRPTDADDGWRMDLGNADASNPTSGFIYVICLG
jgi:hypothetical protein